LKDGLGSPNGSIAIKSDNLNIAYNLTEDATKADVEITMNMYWGSF
jgi:hypothetical protein